MSNLPIYNKVNGYCTVEGMEFLITSVINFLNAYRKYHSSLNTALKFKDIESFCYRTISEVFDPLKDEEKR